MAKKTRAQRKMKNQRVQNSSSKTADAALDESLDSDVKAAETLDAATGGVSNGDAANVSSAAGSEKVQAEAEGKKPELTERQKAREAKEQQKRVERARKANARADAKKAKTERKGPKFIWKLVDYIRNVKIEMKRVVWPTRSELLKMSVIVVVALIFFGVLIYVVDSVVTPLLYWYSGLGTGA